MSEMCPSNLILVTAGNITLGKLHLYIQLTSRAL